MLSPRHFRAAALVVLAAFANACSDSSTGPAAVPPADLSQVLAELQPSSLASLNSQISVAPVAGLSAPDPSSCSYDSVTKSFVCPNVSITGITVSRSFKLFDASGNPQTAFDQTTTAAVQMTSSFAGTITTSNSTFVVDQRQDVTLSGLLTGVHTLNGSSLGHANGTVGNGTAATQVSSTLGTTITNLVLPQSSTGANRFPQSGTIAVTNATKVGVLPLVNSSALIAFDGTSNAKVTVTVNGVTSNCTVDLTAQTAALCSV